MSRKPTKRRRETQDERRLLWTEALTGHPGSARTPADIEDLNEHRALLRREDYRCLVEGWTSRGVNSDWLGETLVRLRRYLSDSESPDWDNLNRFSRAIQRTIKGLGELRIGFTAYAEERLLHDQPVENTIAIRAFEATVSNLATMHRQIQGQKQTRGGNTNENLDWVRWSIWTTAAYLDVGPKDLINALKAAGIYGTRAFSPDSEDKAFRRAATRVEKRFFSLKESVVRGRAAVGELLAFTDKVNGHK